MTPVHPHPRIMIEADKRDGKPCIRGMRITVNDVLGGLAHGMTEGEFSRSILVSRKKTSQPFTPSRRDLADTPYVRRQVTRILLHQNPTPKLTKFAWRNAFSLPVELDARDTISIMP